MEVPNGGEGNDTLDGDSSNGSSSSKTFTGFSTSFQAIGGFDHDDGWRSYDRYPRQLADVNGDEYVDIVGFGERGIAVALGNGDGTFKGWGWDSDSGFYYQDGWTSYDENPRHVVDLNGDGLADIVGFGEDATYVSLAESERDGYGDTFVFDSASGIDTLLDFNGDEGDIIEIDTSVFGLESGGIGDISYNATDGILSFNNHDIAILDNPFGFDSTDASLFSFV